MKKNLIGRRAVIVSENDYYDNFKNMRLEITHIAYSTDEHPGYDNTLKGQALCDFKTPAGQDVPFSLYEYEFDLI